jgi:hypothetical protein
MIFFLSDQLNCKIIDCNIHQVKRMNLLLLSNYSKGIILHETPQRLSHSLILLLLPLPIHSLSNMHYYQLPYMRCCWDHMFRLFDRVHVGRHWQLPAVCYILRLLLDIHNLL